MTTLTPRNPHAVTVADLTAGRDTDAIVAEVVFLYRRETIGPDYYGEHGGTEVLVSPRVTLRDIAEYLPRSGPVPLGFFARRWSTDRRATEQVLQQMKRRGFSCSSWHTPDGYIRFRFEHQDGRRGEADGQYEDKPLVVCKAALRAIGYGDTDTD